MVSARFEALVEERRKALRARGGRPQWGEDAPPIGQAGLWYEDVVRATPPSGQHVARQLARLCGDDSKVTIPWRSLAEAVGRLNDAGNLVSYTERGVGTLIDAGWLRKQTIGKGRRAQTTFYLMPGDPVAWLPGDADPTAEDLVEQVA